MTFVVRVALAASLLLLVVPSLARGGPARFDATARAEAVQLSHRDRLYDVAALDGSVFVVGHPGRLLRSRDGGSSFEPVAAGLKEEALFSIAFNEQRQGAIVGRSGLALVTDDAGTSWRKGTVVLDDERPHLFAVAVLPGGAIVAVGEFGVIVRSEDRGKTWSRSTYSFETPPLPSSQVGRCASDGGAESDNSDVVNEARLTDVRFADDAVGFAVGEFGLVLRSEDGGRTFRRQNSCTDKLMYGISAVSAQHALAVGAEGVVVETTDGGVTWLARPTGTSEHLFGVYADAQHALIVGAAGTVLVRAGSEALREAPSGVHTWLTSGWLDAKGRGLIIGGRGSILRTEDGGKTQSRVFGE